MPALLRYHYYCPADRREVPRGVADSTAAAYELIYSGMIPARDDETTEEVLERLVMRHSAEIRPPTMQARTIQCGDVLDLMGRGLWEVRPTGFRLLTGAGAAAPVSRV